MRHSRLVLVSTLSALAVMTAATATQAFIPPSINFGLLKPLDTWKVGTVNAQGAAYCVMINQFDKETTLAFARNTEGYGSVAIDFHQRFFNPREDYGVTLQVDDGELHKFIARASSESSIIVQIGQNENLYNAMNGDGNLSVGLPTADLTFALRKFSGSYASLVNCATKTQPHTGPKTVAMPVPPVEKSTLALKNKDGGLTPEEQAISAAELQKKRDALQAQAEIVRIAEESKKPKTAAALPVQQNIVSKPAQAALNAKELELSTAKALSQRDSQTIVELRAEIAALNVEHATTVAKLQAQAREREAQLEKQLSETQSMHQSVTSNSVRAQIELEQARRDVTELKSQIAFMEKVKEGLTARLDTQDSEYKVLIGKMQDQLNQSRQQTALLESQIFSVAMQKDDLAAQVDTLDRKNKFLQSTVSARAPVSGAYDPAAALTLIEPAAGGRENISGRRSSFLPKVANRSIKWGANGRPLKLNVPTSSGTTQARPVPANDWETVVVQ